MTTYTLRSYPIYFAATVSGAKTHELRSEADLPQVAVGDVLLLQEYDPSKSSYTGASCKVRVTYISPGPQPWLVPGYTLMSTRWMSMIRKPRAPKRIPVETMPIAAS